MAENKPCNMAIKQLCTGSSLNCGKGRIYEIRGTVGAELYKQVATKIAEKNAGELDKLKHVRYVYRYFFSLFAIDKIEYSSYTNKK